jgi:hypothetical protein
MVREEQVSNDISILLIHLDSYLTARSAGNCVLIRSEVKHSSRSEREEYILQQLLKGTAGLRVVTELSICIACQ